MIDKRPADDPAAFPPSPGIAPDAATLLGWVQSSVPARPAVTVATGHPGFDARTASADATTSMRTASPPVAAASRPASRCPVVPASPAAPEAVPLAYEICDGVAPAESVAGDRNGRITKTGDTEARAALFEAAHVMLHRVKKWSGLKA